MTTEKQMAMNRDYSLYNSEPVIRTHTGQWLNIFEPNPEAIKIEDIAVGLSKVCRFGAQTWKFYSVARHSINCVDLVEPEHKLAALLHDSAEAFLGDLAKPIKKKIVEYREIEDHLMRVIAEKFGFQYPLHESVKAADEFLLQKEWDEQMLRKTLHPHECIPLLAELGFMNKFKELANVPIS